MRRAIADDAEFDGFINTVSRVTSAFNFDRVDLGGRVPPQESRKALIPTGEVTRGSHSVQWDGLIEVRANGTGLRTRSDDGRRFWLDLNGDGAFDSSGAEFINNH